MFKVGPAHVWGNSLDTKRNVDLPLERVPAHLRDSGLGDCMLTLFSAEGLPLLTGPLQDDGNRQDSLNHIYVAVEYQQGGEKGNPHTRLAPQLPGGGFDRLDVDRASHALRILMITSPASVMWR